MRFAKGAAADKVWADLASQYDGLDRWYLEALGIGSDLQADSRFLAWKKKVGAKWNTLAGKNLVERVVVGYRGQDRTVGGQRNGRQFLALGFETADQFGDAELDGPELPGVRVDRHHMVVAAQSLKRCGLMATPSLSRVRPVIWSVLQSMTAVRLSSL